MGDYELQKKYFNLGRSIEDTEQHIQRVREAFYQSSMHTRTEPTDDGIITRGFRQETEVVDLVDYIAECRKKSERTSHKIRYFERYLASMPASERKYVYQRYVHRIDVGFKDDIENALADEICEIEEAVNRMYGLPVEAKALLYEEAEPPKDLSDILATLGVG